MKITVKMRPLFFFLIWPPPPKKNGGGGCKQAIKHTRPDRKPPGKHGRPAGGTDAGGGEVVGQFDPVTGEGIDIRCPYRIVSERTHISVSQIIGQENHNVRFEV